MCNVRLFLFQTALASGAAPGLLPFAAVEARGVESRRPLPDLATNRGLGVALVEGPAGAAVEAAGPLSPNFDGAVVVAPLAARKVLLTETGLKDAVFFTVDDVRR